MILDVCGIRFGYGSEDVIDDLSFSAGPGDVVSILGPNGTGKTTLLKCINRVHDCRAGAVLVDGEDILSMKRPDVAKVIGYVPQRAHVSGSTVFESVLIGRKPHMGVEMCDSDVRLAARVIDMIGLRDLSDKYVNEISGGEYQLVQIARALVQNPRVILLDEPTSNLDLGNQHMVMRILNGIVRENGMCAVMTNHDINLALRYSDRFVIMHGGRIHSAGGPEIVTPETIREVYGVEVSIGEVDGRKVVVPR